MKKINYADKGSILNPLKSLQFFARKPITEKLEPRPASENYRGFHLNDMEKCIGCGTCQKVCDNAAITMVKVPSLKEDPILGIRNLRPAIDYGRCCWCALCVDICPTGAIELSREYVHICNGDETDSYFILPQEKGLHGTDELKGWTKTSASDLLDRHRQPMEELPAPQRLDNFDEIVAGFTKQQAEHEASRCVQCGMCFDACPAHMHAPEYIRSIYDGNLEQAVEWMYETNPFSHVCGRVCTHRCETACSLAQEGSDPIAIRWLKRYAMDGLSKTKIKAIAKKNKARKKTGKNIVVIGAGPAGLTAAFDLVKKGHKVVVYEALPKAGGMTRYGIPNYRLPEEMLDRDIEVIESVGVKIECNTRIGADISMEQLQQDNDAVLISIGLQQGRSTRIPGSDHEKVVKAVDLLRKIPLLESFEIPESVVVIGGGNVAMDIARSLARLQKQNYDQINVVVCAMESLGDSFPADDEEITESLEEGIQIFDARGPKLCAINDEGKLNCLHTVKVDSIFDENGRFAPKYDETDEMLHEADMIVEAIGQMSDISILGETLTEELEWDRGRIKTDENGRSSVNWLWSAGDMVNGPDVIHAVADGHKVAMDIDSYLSKVKKAP
ncbi:MAG: FAD-dependent oxidoreductase [Pseudomonadota bacterium]